MKAARLALVALVVLLAGACRVRTELGIDVRDDGSGTVTVAVGLDADAVSKVGDLSAELRTQDLRDAGWTVTGPTQESDGYTWVRATKPFADPEAAGRVFAEISGPGGPFRDFRITRSRSFAHTETRFDGTVDFSAGLPAFSDSDLAKQLDGNALGDDVGAIEQRLGESLDKVFTFQVAVRLPGDVTSNAVAKAANGAAWEPKLSDTSASVLTAKGSSWRIGTLVFTAVAGVAGLALVVVLVRRLRARTR